MTRTYNDPVKQLSREKLREFIQRNVLRYRRSDEVRVVCFPGAEVEGEEGLEVKEVYDSLGIPRSNVVGLEYNLDNARRLENAQLGIEVVPGERDLDYFAATPHHFDVVSLDYTGLKTKSVAETIEFIAARQLLRVPAVLAVNTAGYREHRNVQDYLRDRAHLNFAQDDVFWDEAQKSDNPYLTFVLRGRDRTKKIEDDIPSLRDAFTREVIRILHWGKLARAKIVGESDPYVIGYPNSKEIEKKIAEAFNSGGITAEQGFFLAYPTHMKYFQDYMAHLMGLDKSLNLETVKGKETLHRIVAGLYGAFHKQYITTATERYGYTSNKGTPMEMDLFMVGNHERHLARIRDCFVFDENGTLVLNLDRSNTALVKRFGRALEEIAIRSQESLKHFRDLPLRVDLGSSYVRPPQRERISKKDAIDLLRGGCTPKEIAESYRGFTKMQLAGLKAIYVTQGKEFTE